MPRGFYLGKEVDPRTGALGARLELDPKDLLTHGLVVGMTGSGKTGLAIALIEEALKQGVPVIAIDPKGDLSNLLLLFENLDAASFAPWIDPDAARRDGKDVQTAAAEAAAAWKKGLEEWGLSAADIAEQKKCREAVIYTPGSTAGVPLNILQSLEAPSVSFDSAEEDLRDEIAGIVSGLLGLVRIEADPLRSREYILLSTLIEQAWRAGQGLTLETLIPAVADPPFEKLGALPVESVYPRKERQGLVMALNNLLASPGFETWRSGAPLDVDRMLRAADGRPRLSIVYTAHLSDEERLFVTALLLDKVKTWMRQQPGTTQLRALVYMDEIYGYFPPHPANPPTKRPLITLLKQARAQGVGVVLATQNPVDLDYKGLANMGVWMVGRLQTAQDRGRLKEGLLGAGMDAARLEALLDATRKRVFLLHDVHRPAAVLLHSRWALSYLRGPLTRDEVAPVIGARSPLRPPPDGDHDEDQDEQVYDYVHRGGAGLARHGSRLGLVLAASGGHDRVDGRLDPARVVPGSEPGHHDVGDDLIGRRVGQRAFEAVADLEADLAVLDEDEKDDTVVELLPPHAPALRGADREVLERRRGQLRKDRHHDLVGRLLVEGLQLGLQTLGHLLRDDTRVVVEVMIGRGRKALRARGHGGEDEQSDTEEHRSRRIRPQAASYRGLAVAVGTLGAAGAGEPKLNSTCGGRSAPGCALKYAFSLNPITLAMRLVGNLSRAVLYACACSL